ESHADHIEFGHKLHCNGVPIDVTVCLSASASTNCCLNAATDELRGAYGSRHLPVYHGGIHADFITTTHAVGLARGAGRQCLIWNLEDRSRLRREPPDVRLHFPPGGWQANRVLQTGPGGARYHW